MATLRKLRIEVAVVTLGVALAAGVWLALVSVAVARQPAIFSLGRAGIEIRLEVDRSPDCPSGLLGMCDLGGTGPQYFSVWLYTSPAPNCRTAQRLLAIPVAP